MALKVSSQLEGVSDAVGNLQDFYTREQAVVLRGERRRVNYTHAVKLWESFPQDNSETMPVGEEGLWPVCTDFQVEDL